jgi:uncharacterized protein YcfJ
MDADNKTSKTHPLIYLAAAAAIAITLACLAGVAAMMGLLPNFNKSTPPPVVAINTVEATAPVATAPVVAAAPKPEPAPAPKVAQKKPVKKPIKQIVSPEPAYQTNQYSQAPRYCPNCGVVESVRVIEQEAPTSGIGAGVGAVVGGVIGNQVGNGNGRTLATIAGAVGGGYAGNAIEKRGHTSISYEVIVRMENGGRQRFMMHAQRWRRGDLVRVDNGNLYAR